MIGNWNAADLRAAAAKHEEIAQKYRELAALLDQEHENSMELPFPERRSPSGRRTREIFNYLSEVGAATAEEIHSALNIPLATVYAVCKEPTLFIKDGSRWNILRRNPTQ